MKNPQNGAFYLLAINKESYYITLTRSDIGVVRAWHGYSDNQLAVASGYGYDKESHALAFACAKLSGIEKFKEAGGVGVNHLKTLVAEAGGRLYDRHDAIEFIYNDITANNY